MRSFDRIQAALRALTGSLAALACVATAGTALAQGTPAGTFNRPKPIVMLLVDTSGSMERLPNTETVVDQLPDCSVAQKNRWAVTLESLTGTFTGFSCTEEDRSTYATSEYDYGYFMPHYRPSFVSQTPTGILDTYADRAKFGLMTFDPIATYVEGPVFVSHDALTRNPGRTGASGMYSYGEVGKLVFPGCPEPYGVDNGARNDEAPSGALVSPGVSDNAPAVAMVNQSIQEALLGASPTFTGGIRPFGGTPVAGMLDDLTYFFENDPGVAPGSDPYAQCRDRAAILITDGVPDSDFRDARFDCDVSEPANAAAGNPCASAGEECQCPYDLVTEYVADLCQKDGNGNCGGVLNKGFYVVALSLAGDDAAVDELNLIALEGGTEAAYLANDAAGLNNALSTILDSTATEANTRVAPVIRLSELGQQYELTAGFEIPADGSAWRGVLQRQRYGCDGLVPQVIPLSNSGGVNAPKDLLHAYLDDPSYPMERNILALAVPLANAYDVIKSPEVDADDYAGATLNRVGVTNPLANDGSGNPTFGVHTLLDVEETSLLDLSTSELNTLGLDALGGGSGSGGLLGTLTGGLSDLDGDGSTDDADAAWAYDWLAGLNDTRGSKLGAVYHSQPVVVSPPVPDTTNDGFNAFAEALALQPEVVIVATGDGLLHAFSLEESEFSPIPGTAVGDFESAYGLEPGDLAVEEEIKPGQEIWAIAPPAALASLADAASGTQLLFDGSPIVRLVTADRAIRDNDTSTYRRVLIAALRNLPAFVAFDITNVTKPKFLWQFTHPMLGKTTGQPVVGQLAVAWNDGQVYNRSIALFPGGEGESNASCDGGGAPGSSRLHNGATLTATGLDRRDNTVAGTFNCWNHQGRYLYAVDVTTGSLVQVFDQNHFAAPLTGGLALNVDGLGLNATAGYVTDEDGILYRIDFSDNQPQDWKVEAIYDPFADGTDGGRPAIYPPVVRTTEAGDTVIVLATGDIDNPGDDIAHRVASISERIDAPTGTPVRVLEENWNLTLNRRESVTGPLVFFDEGVYFSSFISVDPGAPSANLCSVGESRIWGVDYLRNEGGAPIGRLPDPLDRAAPDVTDYDSEDMPELAGNLLVGLTMTQQPTCTLETTPEPGFFGTRSMPSAVGGGAYSLRAMVAGGGGTRSSAGAALSELNIEVNQPTTSVRRISGGFGSVLE